jgi:branched-chain amino acid transport system permease protein
MSTAAAPATDKPKTRFRAPELSPRQNLVLAAVVIVIAAVIPFFIDGGGAIMNNMVLAAAYVVMALGLNIIVGFAGLLDLGYVAFYAIGAYTVGYFGSTFWDGAGGGEGIHLFVGEALSTQPGIHVNFLIILVLAVIAVAIAGILIGLPATTSRS